MVALSLGAFSLRGIATQRLPAWFAYVGVATAGLLAATAVCALFGLSAAVAQIEQFSLPALSLWLICTGVLLLRLQERPHAAAAVGERTEPVDPAKPAG
jgi:hypothetical protein